MENQRPAEGRWSAGELIGYPSTIERDILSRAKKLLRKPRRSVPFFKRVHFDRRSSRHKARVPLEPQMIGEWKGCWSNGVKAFIESDHWWRRPPKWSMPIVSGAPERPRGGFNYRLA